MRSTGRILALAVMASLLAAGCGPDDKDDDVNGKNIDKSAQTDPAPVLARTTGLPEDSDFLWYSGTLGSDAPGPSSYWVDAKVTTSDAETTALRALCPAPENATPDVVPDLADDLGATDFVTCDALGQSLAADGWTATAWVSASSPILVVSLVGQG